MSGLKKKRFNNHCLQETHFHCKDKQGLRVKGWKKTFQTMATKRKQESFTLITSDKTDKTKNAKKKKKKTRERNKGSHYIKVKRSIQQTDITIYEPNIRAYKYIKQQLTELMRKINSIIIINNNI